MEKLRSKALQILENQYDKPGGDLPPHDVILSSGSVVRGMYPSASMPEVPTIGVMLYTDNHDTTETFIKKFTINSMKVSVEQDNLEVTVKQDLHEQTILRVPLRAGTRALSWSGVWALQFIQQSTHRITTRILHCDNRTGEILADSGVKHVSVFDTFSNTVYVTRTVH